LPRYLIIADGEIEEKISIALHKKLRELSPHSPVFLLSLLWPGNFRKRGLKEIRWRSFPHFSTFWCSFCKTFWRRRGWREEIVLVSARPLLLFFLFLLTGKKAVLVRSSKAWDLSFSLLERFLVKYFARVVFVDDYDLVKVCRLENIPIYFSGNVLADLLSPGDFSFPAGGKTVMVLFPRAFSLERDLIFLQEVAEEMALGTPAYFLLVVPGRVKVQEIREKAEKMGWHWRRSLEGETIEGYLCKGKTYINVTSFYQEALRQGDFVVSCDFVRVIQAAGFGKKVLPVFHLSPKEVAALLRNPTYLFEYNLILSRRFGERGGIEKIAGFLLFGVVEDQKLVTRGA